MALPKFLSDLNPDIYLSNNYLVLDFETDTSHGAEYYGHPRHSDNSLILTCYKLGKQHPDYSQSMGASVSIWDDEIGLSSLLDAISQADFIVAHNAKYELGWLKRAGLDLRTVLAFDTKLAEVVLLGNLAAGDDDNPPRDTSLDECCRRRGLPIKDPVVDLLINDGINPVAIPRPWLEGRCRQDVETTEQVFLSQREALREQGSLGVLYTRCLLTPILAEIEQEGMRLDGDRVREEHAKHLQEFVRLNAEMDELTGGINWKSPIQVAEFLYDKLKFQELTDARSRPKRTPSGKRATAQKVLDKLVATTEEQKNFLALRKKLGKVNAALSKNLDFFIGVVEEYGGEFFGEFHQHKTATDRLSSTGVPLPFKIFGGNTKSVQFQNMPRRFKRLLRAKRDGWYIFEADGSMLEFRVAAFLGQDSRAIADVKDVHWDAHITSASEMYQVSYEELYEAWKAGDKEADRKRTNAKTETFKPLYGGEKGTPEQERWYKAFRKRYPELAEVQAGWVREVVDTKVLKLPWGKRFYWPHAKVNSYGGVRQKNAIYNYPVQSLATAEIIPIAIIFFWHRLKEAGIENDVYIVNTVHDSVAVEVRDTAIEQVRVLAKRCFTLDVYNYLSKVYKLDFNVPLGVGMKHGTHWSEGKEEAYDIYPDGTEVRRK